MCRGVGMKNFLLVMMLLFPLALMGQDGLAGVWQLDKSDLKYVEGQLMPMLEKAADQQGYDEQQKERFIRAMMVRMMCQRMVMEKKDGGVWGMVYSADTLDNKWEVKIATIDGAYFMSDAKTGQMLGLKLNFDEEGKLWVYNAGTSTLMPFEKVEQKVLDAEKEAEWMEGEWALDMADEKMVDDIVLAQIRRRAGNRAPGGEQLKEILKDAKEDLGKAVFTLAKRANGNWLYTMNLKNGQKPLMLVMRMEKVEAGYQGNMPTGGKILFGKREGEGLMLHEQNFAKPLPLRRVDKK